ncbi:hypothetical protein IAU59_005961 [Kwoniella sp. CBS 9459]
MSSIAGSEPEPDPESDSGVSRYEPGDSAYQPSPSRRRTGDEAPEASSSTTTAPYRHLPKHIYTSIEYPGPLSHTSSILKVVNQDDIDECFNSPAPPAGGSRPMLEMRYRGEGSAGGPVRGHRVPSQKLLLRVVRRRRKGKEREDAGDEGGVFTAEVVGSVPQTVRFRSMADYHWKADPNGPTASLIQSLKDLDYNAILDYKFPPLDEEYTEPIENPVDPKITHRSRLDLQPLPLFSTRNLPFVYKFEMSNKVEEERFYDRRTNTYRRRYVNRGRAVNMAPINLKHDHTPQDVPTVPTKLVQSKMPELNQTLLKKLKGLFDERPVWMRHSLLAQLEPEERAELPRNKAYIPAVAYVMDTGPFWKCLVRYGYDPCADPVSGKYQRIFFYANKKTVKNPITAELYDDDDDEVQDKEKSKAGWKVEQERLAEEGFRPPLDPKRTHIFDGQHLNRERADYQLCDVTDPLIAKYINEVPAYRKKCSKLSGWYPSPLFALIKALVRTKYMYIWENHAPAPDRICWEIIGEYEKERADQPAGTSAAAEGDEEEDEVEGLGLDQDDDAAGDGGEDGDDGVEGDDDGENEDAGGEGVPGEDEDAEEGEEDEDQDEDEDEGDPNGDGDGDEIMEED